MKLVIAMDSFKGTLTAYDACQTVADAIAECVPNAQFVIKPMADGGEGTAQAMIKAANGRWIRQTVMGPLEDMQVEAGFAFFDADQSALVEMAAASGLELLGQEQMNPLKATTYGTGQLIKAALEYGASRIFLAVGGSATIDGGLGAAAALGWQFLNKDGDKIPLGGTGLDKLAAIVRPENLELVPVVVLCDVDNPLCGERGAVRIYGPQKGATPQMVENLEKGMENLAALVSNQLGIAINNVPGAGAAGGLAAGALAFMNAKLISGIEAVIDLSNLNRELDSADWIVTGEGSFDQQSLYGKVICGIAKIASQSNAHIAVLAGQVTVPQEVYKKFGITIAFGCRKENMSLDYALTNSRELLFSAAKRFAKHYL
ncbi:glycerate kinase [Planctomycetota bacterium]